MFIVYQEKTNYQEYACILSYVLDAIMRYILHPSTLITDSKQQHKNKWGYTRNFVLSILIEVVFENNLCEK